MTTALLDYQAPIVDEATRRQFLAGLAAAGLLAGCGSAEPPAPAAPEGWSFTDDRQETVTLPERPARVAMQEDVAGALLPFGVRPSAVFGNAPLADSPQFEGEDITGIEEVGIEFGVINLEKLAALDPDLIVVPWSRESPDDVTWMGFQDDGQFELAGQIAPILALNVTGVPYSQMIERFTELAGALGADLGTPELVRMREEFDAAVTDLEAAAAAQPDLTVLAVSPTADLVYLADTDTELLEYRAAGVSVAEVTSEAFFEEVSWERIGEYPSDVILRDARPFGDNSFLATQPVWQGLPAVEADQVGEWYVGTMYRMPFFTAQLRELTALIGRSQDVV